MKYTKIKNPGSGGKTSLKRTLTSGLTALVFMLSIGAAPALQGTATPPIPSFAPILKDTMPAVVHIGTESMVQIRPQTRIPDAFKWFFELPQNGGPPAQRRQGSFGSGVVIDSKNGYIVTNSHVVSKADNIKVTLGDGREFEAKLIGDDKAADIAVVQIEAEDLIEMKPGDSSLLEPGDFVLAIGNPFGLQQTVTSGIVSALGRSGLGIESYEDFIQTDASINPGNSGGALINLKGKLVGINTAIYGPNRGNVGIGFAIPINMVMEIFSQLIEHGEVKRGRLGVVIQTLTPALAKAFNLDRNKGTIIVEVEEDTPAADAGLMPGDIVLSVNGERMESSADMRNFIGLVRVGARISLEVLRDSKKISLTATIEETKYRNKSGEALSKFLKGATLEVVRDDAGETTIKVKEVKAGSPANRSGLLAEDLILGVNQRPVRNFDEMRAAIRKNDSLLLRLKRGNNFLFLAMR